MHYCQSAGRQKALKGIKPRVKNSKKYPALKTRTFRR